MNGNRFAAHHPPASPGLPNLNDGIAINRHQWIMGHQSHWLNKSLCYRNTVIVTLHYKV